MTSRTRAGFTLVEVLLVCLIMGLVAAVATPTFINSMKGQRLRQATRSVTGCGRYARVMAVSRQRPMHLILAVGGSRLAVEEGAPVRAASTPVYTRDQLEAIASDRGLPPLDIPAADAPPPPPPGPARGIVRELEGVTIKSLTIRDGLRNEEGPATITYKSNGTCPAYEITLVDEDGAESVIRVDFLGDAVHEES